jgi:methyl-accepting chemotaxis protein
MNTFNNLKVGTKILIGFLTILILMVIISSIALFQIIRIQTTVTHLADRLASDQHLADQLVVKILQVRLHVNKYIFEQKPENLTRSKEEIALLAALLTKATENIIEPVQVKLLADIKADVQTYENSFAEITKLIDERNQILVGILDVQGPLAEEKLEQLRDQAFQANDASTSFYAGNLQRALLLMRLEVFKYLGEGDPQRIPKFEARYQEAQVAVKKLDDTLKANSTLHQLAQEVNTAINLYHQSFQGLQTNSARQNQLVETNLNKIGTQVRQISSDLSDSITADFASANQATQALVAQTWKHLLITLSIAILIGLSLGIAISRNITVPMATVVAMTNQMIVGNLIQREAENRRNEISKVIARGDEMGDIGRAFDALTSYIQTLIEDIVQVSQGLAAGNLQVTPQAEYRGDYARIKTALEIALADLKQVIEDLVQIAQGLVKGNLRVTPKAEYRGDFVQIKTALSTALADLSQVVADIVQASQSLAEGKQRIVAQAEYRGDFAQVKNALETASTKLVAATAKNATQDWLKTGQTLLNEQMRGEQEVITLAKNIITFLTSYVEAQVGVFYLWDTVREGNREISHLKLVASYAYTHRKGLPTEFQLGEGLIGQAALEQQIILVTDVPDDYIHIESGLGEAVPQNILVMPFLYENTVKGVIELGSFHTMTEVQLEFLKQVMLNIGIAVNTAESRTKMQALLQGKGG